MTLMHKKLLTLLAVAAAAIAPVAVAVGASKPHHAKKHHTAKKRQTNSSTSADAHRTAESPLTGDTKTSAESAAIAANPGATVERSSAEDPAENTGAAYEVHITKADGTRAEVLEDSSFTVLSTKADDHGGPGGPDGDHHGHGRPGGPGNPNETALTGDTKTSAEKAATDANPGATVEHSSTEDPAETSGAAYEVHIEKADDTYAVVLEDSSFNVLSTTADDHGGRGPRH